MIIIEVMHKITNFMKVYVTWFQKKKKNVFI